MNKNTKILLFIGFIILCLYLSYESKEGFAIDAGEFEQSCRGGGHSCTFSLSGSTECSDDDVGIYCDGIINWDGSSWNGRECSANSSVSGNLIDNEAESWYTGDLKWASDAIENSSGDVQLVAKDSNGNYCGNKVVKCLGTVINGYAHGQNCEEIIENGEQSLSWCAHTDGNGSMTPESGNQTNPGGCYIGIRDV